MSIRLIFFLFPIFLIMFACERGKEKGAGFPQKIPQIPKEEVEAFSGEQLAKIYCGNCHLFPEPSLLPKNHWIEGVLPWMAVRLGLPQSNLDPLKGVVYLERHRIVQANIFPSDTLIDSLAWEKIVAYYQENAPDSFALDAREYNQGQQLFKSISPSLDLEGAPFISMVKFDEKDNLYLGDWSGHLMRLDRSLGISTFTQFSEPVVDVGFDRTGTAFGLGIGYLHPNDELTGQVASVDTATFNLSRTLIRELPRPVHLSVEDLDADGLDDLLVCSFGNYVGDLSWYKNQGDGTYAQRVIKNTPGATKTLVEDLNGDERPDIVALFAQGDEGISLFFNEGDRFKEQRVLRFNPLYGSNDFELLDFDGDGDKDLILTNGDNGDYSITLKPHHGVRIFLNTGDYQFEEVYFFPMYGASKARVSDFDLDGDLDVVACSFFPDTQEGIEQSIVYLENNGAFQFTPYQIEGAASGRWMVMDAGDYDLDGDVDVVFGSFTLTNTGIDKATLERWRNSETDILVLENQTNPSVSPQ